MQPDVTLFLLLAAAAGEDPAAGATADQPPRLMSDPTPEIARCQNAWSRGGRISGEVAVNVWVDAHGRVTGVASPPDADPQSAQAAQCAVLGLRFEPATRNGEPVAGRLVVPIGFVSPPMMGRLPEPWQWKRCYPKSAYNEGKEGRVEVEVTIGEDGKVVRHTVDAEAEPWLREAADCIVQYLEFRPGLDRGVPVVATVMVPVFFKARDADFQVFAAEAAPTITGMRRKRPGEEDPEPVSSEAEILAAYRDCYPAGHQGIATITYEIRVERSGAVRNIEVAKGSGDPLLDQAGACILGKLKFRPVTINGRAVAEAVHWPLLVRPPP